jgi:hypothetical protein
LSDPRLTMEFVILIAWPERLAEIFW